MPAAIATQLPSSSCKSKAQSREIVSSCCVFLRTMNTTPAGSLVSISTPSARSIPFHLLRSQSCPIHRPLYLRHVPSARFQSHPSVIRKRKAIGYHKMHSPLTPSQPARPIFIMCVLPTAVIVRHFPQPAPRFFPSARPMSLWLLTLGGLRSLRRRLWPSLRMC